MINSVLEVIFKKRVKPSEVKFQFIQIPKSCMSLKSPVTIIVNEKNFLLNINAANRIVSKKIFLELDVKPDNFIVLKKNEKNNYVLTKIF